MHGIKHNVFKNWNKKQFKIKHEKINQNIITFKENCKKRS